MNSTSHNTLLTPKAMPPQQLEQSEDQTEEISSNAITQLPIQLQPRRKRVRRTKFQPLKRRRPLNASPSDAASAAGPDADDDAAVAALSGMRDTHVAVMTLRSQWPGEAAKCLPRTPPVIPRSQIYALVADATIVDRELLQLVAEGTLRPITIPASTVESRREAFVFTEDFDASAVADDPVLHPFFTTVFKQCRRPVVQCDLLSTVYGDEMDDAVTKLIRSGYLTLKDETNYTFALPGMAEFVKNRKTGDLQITKTLKAAQYREMTLPNLENRTLKNTIFTAQWHVRDLVGSGVISTVSTSIGTLVRLPHDL